MCGGSSNKPTDATRAPRRERWRKGLATYRSGEFSGLCGLPALLANWRQWGAQGGNIVCCEAPVELAAGVVCRADGTNTAMQRGEGRLVAGRAQAAAAADARGKGHGSGECYKYTAAARVSANMPRERRRVGLGAAGGEGCKRAAGECARGNGARCGSGERSWGRTE